MPKIYLSPSFQDQNVGVGNYGTEEKRCNEIADVVERELKKNSSFTVVRNNPNMSLEEVIRDSNNSNSDVHFSIHTNAGVSSARGCEVYAYSPNTEADKLAQIVYKRLSKITPSSDRGVKYNSLAETGSTKAIAVLTEVGFHSNAEDAKWIIDNTELIGKELAKALYEYYNIKYKETSETVATPEKKQSIEELARDVINGKYGNNPQRKETLIAQGYDYDAIQNKVNELLQGSPSKKSNEEIANEIIAGKWGNQPQREQKLKAEGYDYEAIQKIVNQKIL